ncbi:MAG: LysR substrate-binding domain-containing protein, partial [Actinomycetota bacterium]|nr:LysR substrate-binding domain-containing protein [Actinomycetota bacterium]
ALRHVRAATPRLRVTVRSIEPGSAVAEIASGGVDLALVDGIAGPDEPLSLTDSGLLSSSALLVSPLAVVLAGNHPLAQRSSIDLDVLADAPWIATPGLAAIPVQPRPPACRSDTTGPAGTEPPMGPAAVTYQGNDLPTLFALVAAGHGAALLPAPACHHVQGIAVVPLAAPQLVHRTEVLTLRGGSLRFRPLLEALRTVIKSMAT